MPKLISDETFGYMILTSLAFVVVLLLVATPDEPVKEEPAAVEQEMPDVPKPASGTLERLEVEVSEALGSSNRGVERVTTSLRGGVVDVRFTVNRNLTDSMTKTGVRHDLWKILKAVSDSGVEFQALGVIGTFPLSGDEANAVRIVAAGDSVDAIDWKSFTPDDVYEFGEAWIHPKMK